MVVPGVRFLSAPKGRDMLRLPARGRHVTRATHGRSPGKWLLGFLEMIWDPNRQTMHDRIAATVVLRRRQTPVPAPEADRGP